MQKDNKDSDTTGDEPGREGNGADERAAEDRRLNYQGPAPKVKASGGFFHVYKSGQGYWTRMMTAAGGVLLILLTAQFLYRYAMVGASTKLKGLVVAAFCAVAAGLVWWVMNKPTNADFLIATDSEMKKVNWTTRQELIGSTKVVIFFMFLIATLLFVTDLLFGEFFKLIGVLKHGYF